MAKKPILSYFSGKPRPVQKETLLELEKQWNDYDVFVINAPVGSGKSRIAMCIADWQWSVDIITPTNMLVEQYTKEFSNYPKMLKKSMYTCCIKNKYSKSHDCERKRDTRRAFAMKRCIMNYYMYMSLFTRKRKPGNVLVIDEAHNLIPTLQSLMAKKLWRHDYPWPDNLYDYADLEKWATSLKSSDPNVRLLIEQCRSHAPTYIFEKTKEWWHRTKVPEQRDVLNVKPVEVSRGPSYFWGSHVQKLVLMSSTINRKDIETMGLNKKKVLYLETASAIPAQQRPIVFDAVVPVTYNDQVNAAEKIAQRIKEYYLPLHKTEKGIVHCTYEMAERLKVMLKDEPRLMWHDKYNKNEIYEEFKRSSDSQPKVLIASGLYEGIDLPGDTARWQIIAKVPWISLADKAIEYKAKQDIEWYRWQTLKDLIQATGRICRGPTDYGITYVLDSTFEKLYNNSQALLPEWWKEAISMETV